MPQLLETYAFRIESGVDQSVRAEARQRAAEIGYRAEKACYLADFCKSVQQPVFRSQQGIAVEPADRCGQLENTGRGFTLQPGSAAQAAQYSGGDRRRRRGFLVDQEHFVFGTEIHLSRGRRAAGSKGLPQRSEFAPGFAQDRYALRFPQPQAHSSISERWMSCSPSGRGSTASREYSGTSTQVEISRVSGSELTITDRVLWLPPSVRNSPSNVP